MKVCWCDDDGGGFVGRKADFGCDSPACSAKASFERASACRAVVASSSYLTSNITLDQQSIYA